MHSYSISPDGTAITCHRCGRISHSANDVQFHYCGNCHQFHDDVETISHWVIYCNPSDYPNDFVLRRHLNVFIPGQPPAEVAENACHVGPLDELRKMIPMGAVLIGPWEGDEPTIFEVWMQ